MGCWRWQVWCAVTVLALGFSVAQAALPVAVSVMPQKTLVERIGGERVAVRVLVGRGASPATYDPSPRQLAQLSGTRVYFRVGVPFESTWLPRLRRLVPEMEVVDLRDGVDLLDLPEHDHGNDHDHGHDHGHSRGPEAPAPDPHIWTSPRRAQTMADTILDTLVRLDPDGAGHYRTRHARLLADLQALDQELRRRLAEVGGRSFLVFHPAWGYFADDYGLRQVAIQRQGRSPGPAGLDAVIRQARAAGARLVVVQREFSQGDARAVAEAMDGRVEVLDPLSPEYFETLRRAAAVMAEAL